MTTASEAKVREHLDELIEIVEANDYPLEAALRECARRIVADLADLSKVDRNETQTHHPAGDTERAAAYKALPRSGSLRQAVLGVFVRAYQAGDGALTAEMVHERMPGQKQYSVYPRITELVQGEWIVRTDTIENHAGNPTKAYELSDGAVARLDVRRDHQRTIDQAIEETDRG